MLLGGVYYSVTSSGAHLDWNLCNKIRLLFGLLLTCAESGGQGRSVMSLTVDSICL